LGIAEVLHELDFGFARGAPVAGHIGAEFAVGGFVFAGKEDGLGGESVFQGILRGDGFTGVRNRTGAVLRVGGIGPELDC
jgi:hypothetical protein